jgi:peptidoglycan hydrolase CwlO-like protein
MTKFGFRPAAPGMLRAAGAAAAASMLALLLSACDVSTDPHTGGFFGGVVSLARGDYDRRAEQKQSDLAASENINWSMQRDVSNLDTAIRGQDAEITRLRGELNRMRAETERLKRDVASMSASGPTADLDVTRKQIDAVQQRITDLQAKITANTASASRYGEEVDALENELHRLEEIYANMAATR